jgi:hypothetical protein
MINFKTEFEYKRPDEPSRNRHFVAGGTAYGFDFYVVNQGGWHPCAYVVLHKGHVFNGVPYYDIPLECHGGLTYGQPRLEGVKLEDGEYVIGWDYAHYGDYMPDASGGYGAHKKWTTTEIVNEVTEVCKQLRELNDKEG